MGERDAEGRSHYDRIRAYYRTNDVTAYDESLFYDAETNSLTSLFYKSDRSMRESGFDPSNRFGPFNAGIIHHAPVASTAFSTGTRRTCPPSWRRWTGPTRRNGGTCGRTAFRPSSWVSCTRSFGSTGSSWRSATSCSEG